MLRDREGGYFSGEGRTHLDARGGTSPI